MSHCLKATHVLLKVRIYTHDDLGCRGIVAALGIEFAVSSFA